jgi:hypothetical protein
MASPTVVFLEDLKFLLAEDTPLVLVCLLELPLARRALHRLRPEVQLAHSLTCESVVIFLLLHIHLQRGIIGVEDSNLAVTVLAAPPWYSDAPSQRVVK